MKNSVHLARSNPALKTDRFASGLHPPASGRLARSLERVETPLSLLDRLKFALIGAGFGVVMGAALLFVCIFGFAVSISPADVILFSAAYFAFVGLIMGAFVGDLVGASIGGLLNLLAIDNYMHPQFTDERTFRPIWIGLSFVLWLVASWLIYLRL